jgi:2,3-bisphosphoglycerate-independent phosphoglycerate mutase
MAHLRGFSPTMLVIVDGFGHRNVSNGNAVALAKMPTWDSLLQKYPHTLLEASGEAVGLPPGYMGNSEVGHTCIGAGRTVKTVLAKCNESIADKSFFSKNTLTEAFSNIKKNNKSLHLMGLLSDAGIHSHEKHLYALLTLAKQMDLPKVFIHPFLDGRDTPPRSAVSYLEKLESFCKKLGCGKIATIHGRFYAMDRDKNWDRTRSTYDILTKTSTIKLDGWERALEYYYSEDVTDEFIPPTSLTPEGLISDGDGIVFFNFRPDRAKQLTEAFINPKFNGFDLSQKDLCCFVSMVQYDASFAAFNNPVLFKPEAIEHTLLDEIAEQSDGKPVFIIAETEKYAHVTYFFRGKRDITLPHETRVLIPSKKVKTYEEIPEMSAPEITSKLLESLQNDPAYFYLVNYANLDMVGHSGNLNATVKACECIDEQLQLLHEEVVVKQGGTLFITADHGNAEEMIDVTTGAPKTSHSCNPVPFIMCQQGQTKLQTQTKNPGLSSIAPTILKQLRLKIPHGMEQKTIYL